jgi:glycosyltransferase involved in cell wall biosynthesis
VWGAFSDEKKVYECYDEYAMNPDGSVRTRVQRMERGVLRDADLTLVTAEELAARRRQDVGHVVFVPNGVAEDFMRDPMAADFLRHTARKPCIGYLGHLRSEVDVDLLVALAAQNPQWHFLLVGPVQRSEFRRRLDLLPNVEFAGPQPYGSLPSLLRRFDVGLIPFVLNSFTLAINPLKAYEYMAAGVPIVASNLPELLRFRDIIRMIENTPAAFGKAIAETLADDRAALSLRLTTRAREYTWERISREVVVPELVQLVE